MRHNASTKSTNDRCAIFSRRLTSSVTNGLDHRKQNTAARRSNPGLLVLVSVSDVVGSTISGRSICSAADWRGGGAFGSGCSSMMPQSSRKMYHSSRDRYKSRAKISPPPDMIGLSSVGSSIPVAA